MKNKRQKEPGTLMLIYNNVNKKAFNFSLWVYLHGMYQQKLIQVK